MAATVDGRSIVFQVQLGKSTGELLPKFQPQSSPRWRQLSAHDGKFVAALLDRPSPEVEASCEKREVLARTNVRFPWKVVPSGLPLPSHQFRIATDTHEEDLLICSLNWVHNTNIAKMFRQEPQALATQGVYRYAISSLSAPADSNTPHYQPMASAPPPPPQLPVHPELPRVQKESPGRTVTLQAPRSAPHSQIGW